MLGRPDPVHRRRRLAMAAFFLTGLSVFVTRALWWQQGASWRDPGVAADSLSFTVALLGILGAHELGHLVAAHRHGFSLSLPWFMPFPIWIGTLGAVISLRERPRHREGLVALGASGPVAGLLATAVVLWHRGPVAEAPLGELVLGTPLLFQIESWLTGSTAVVSTADPLGFAAWIGCLVTMMNLLPFGQLDGGHVLAGLWPQGAKRVSWAVTAALLAAGLIWPGWAAWAAVLHLLGTRRPVRVRDDGRQPVGVAGRRWALAALTCGVLTFMPVPVSG